MLVSTVIINIISCSIVLNIVLSLCSVTKANTHLKVFLCFEGLSFIAILSFGYAP